MYCNACNGLDGSSAHQEYVSLLSYTSVRTILYFIWAGEFLVSNGKGGQIANGIHYEPLMHILFGCPVF